MKKQEEREFDIINQNLLRGGMSHLESILFRDIHSRNVAYYCYKIGFAIGFQPSNCLALFMGGILHDIGKTKIPKEILSKPSRLTNEEYEIVKQHPRAGYDILRNVLGITDETILAVTLYHHERFDGKGYPFGLRGEDTPLVARIAAVADAFDAMTSNRIYQTKRELWEAVVELRKHRGLQFDPYVTDLFVDMITQGEGDVDELLLMDTNSGQKQIL